MESESVFILCKALQSNAIVGNLQNLKQILLIDTMFIEFITTLTYTLQ